MTTQGFSGMGSVLTFDGVTVGEVESFDGGGIAIGIERILTMDSTDYYSDAIATDINPGQFQITCIFQPSGTTGNYSLLKTKAEARTKGTLLLTYANTASFTGQAIIANLGYPTAPDANGVQRFNVTFERAGKFTYTGT